MKERTRKHVRATLATVCALSLAASMAFPLAAMAQANATEEAVQLSAADTPADQPAITLDQPVIIPETGTPESATDQLAITGQFVTTDQLVASIDRPAINDDRSATSGNQPATAAQPAPAAETEAPVLATPESSSPASGVGSQGVAVASDVMATSDAMVNASYVRVRMYQRAPAEYARSGAGLGISFCSIPSGMSFAEAKQQDAFDKQSGDDPDFFFQLGTDVTIGIGDQMPRYPGFTFQGWIDLATGDLITEDMPINASSEPLVLEASWQKDGSNVSFLKSTDDGLLCSASGVLAGSNIPSGADLRVQVSGIYEAKPYYDEFGADSVVIGPANFHAEEVRLLVNGKEIHDGFGLLNLSFFSDSFKDGTMVRVWHKHADGSITYEDVKPVNEIVSVSVTDLSILGLGLLKETGGSSGEEQPGDDQKPGTNGGNQGTQQPGGNEGDGGDKKDEVNNKNDGNGDKKTDDGKQGGSSDKGGNNKSVSSLAKTGDEMRYALGGTMAALTIALFSGGTALLMGNCKRPAHRRR